MSDLRARLLRLSQNLWWSWNDDLDGIFRDIDRELWRDVNHNPVEFLQQISPENFATKDSDASILAQTIRAEKHLDDYLKSDRHWTSWNAPALTSCPVAYFSFEFCIHESLPIYSGGLGVLAGDHLKACSDLGVPAFGVTLLYRQGYFHQQIDSAGRQNEVYNDLDASSVPIQPVAGPDGTTLTIEIPVADTVMVAEIWRARVGRCDLILLNLCESEANPAAARVFRLYGGDKNTRMLQELALGIGGYRALRKLGVRPGVLHLNEGHCAFATLEAIAERMERTGLPFGQVADEVAESTVFTTHTPVAAGHDFFDPGQVLHVLRPMQARLGLSDQELLALGRVNPHNPNEEFCMTVLALKLSRRANAVSSLHGLVSRRMWQNLWPDRRPSEVPIGHITNGAHVDTWLSDELAQLYGDCLGSDWRDHVCDPVRWRRIEGLDEFQLWSIKVILKQRLLEFVRRRLEVRRDRVGERLPLPNLRTDVLTIGFARRFAAYKRATLFFEDYDRARRLLTNPDRPIQILFAGKAHPADEPGKGLIRRLHELSQDPALRDHIVLIEDHDKNLSRHLIEGCDLWLNSPRRPLEACGTSGMKAVFNGTLNCSTLDGWWDEAYDTRNGFAFGDGMVFADPAQQDKHDADSLLEVLTTRVVPLFYERNGQHIPLDWLQMVKHALKTLAWRYNADRMVMDYTRHMYLPASRTQTARVIF
ncbi:MAG TPA: alpha-glucan family phosphorylase [Polyangiales bacterium]